MIVEILAEGGEAKPDQKFNSKISSFGIDPKEVLAKINEAIKEYAGLDVLVKVEVDTTNKTYEIHIETPEVSELVKKELGIEKAKIAEESKEETVGNLSMEQVLKITKLKMPDLMAKSFKAAVKQVIGSISSMMGVFIDGKKPKEVLKEIEEGKYEELLKSYESRIKSF